MYSILDVLRWTGPGRGRGGSPCVLLISFRLFAIRLFVGSGVSGLLSHLTGALGWVVSFDRLMVVCGLLCTQQRNTVLHNLVTQLSEWDKYHSTQTESSRS